MRGLAETQADFRAAITGATRPDHLLLVAPASIDDRLDIYRRHWRESFRRHLRARFPTVEWLIGTEKMLALADDTLRISPPRAPSLAEYGAQLVATIEATAATWPAWLADVARLDWSLGRVSVAIDAPALPMGVLAAHDPDRLALCHLVLQPGLDHLRSAWPVDELVHLHLGGTAPSRLNFSPADSRIELRGARGQFSLKRLSAGDFALRRALAAGANLGDAMSAALTDDPQFAIGPSLAALFGEGLVTAIQEETT